MRAVAWLNAAIAVLLALLGAAPFTAAVLAHAVTLPVCAFTAARPRQARTTVPSCVAWAAALAGLALSPMTLANALHPPLEVWTGWVAFWAMIAGALLVRRGAAAAPPPSDPSLPR